MLIRRLLKGLALAIGLSPVGLVILLLFVTGSQSTSLAVVSPNGLWILAGLFFGPIALGFMLWRLALLIKA